MNDVLRYIQIITTFVPIVMLMIALVWWSHKRANEILHRWVEITGVTLISAEKRYFRTGPYFMNHGRGQMIFRINVRDSAGVERTGWVRVGSWFGGIFSDKTHVTWDKSK